MPRLLDHLSHVGQILKQVPNGFITDIDGTISPSSTDPLNVQIPQEHLQYLSILVKKLSLVAVVSGRGTAEIKRMVNVPGVKCVGHYGLEWNEGNNLVPHPVVRPYLPAMRALAAELETLHNVEGVVIQDKGATISLHYRLSPHPEKTKAIILNKLNQSLYIKTLRIIEEKLVVGIIPPVDHDKGDAVATLIQQNRLKSAIYLGDDTVDVPGFRAIHQTNNIAGFNGLAVLVTGKDTPSEIIQEADFTLDGVKEIGLLLQWLTRNIG